MRAWSSCRTRPGVPTSWPESRPPRRRWAGGGRGHEALAADGRAVARLLDEVKAREFEGWSFDRAEASFDLLVRRVLQREPLLFRLVSFRVLEERVRPRVRPDSDGGVSDWSRGVSAGVAEVAEGPDAPPAAVGEGLEGSAAAPAGRSSAHATGITTRRVCADINTGHDASHIQVCVYFFLHVHVFFVSLLHPSIHLSPYMSVRIRTWFYSHVCMPVHICTCICVSMH